MKKKLGFFLGFIIIFSISLSALIPMVKSYNSTEYLNYAESTCIGLPYPLAENDVLRWAFRTYNEEFLVRVTVENGAGFPPLSDGLTNDGGDWLIPWDIPSTGDYYFLCIENIDTAQQRGGSIDINFVLNPQPETIPGFNLLFLLGILSVVIVILTKKVKKT
ncbi:MAG: Loki-CTERM sorting domain-containing protein [Promethearchaeota archaeon]|jgi:hypothetical protein